MEKRSRENPQAHSEAFFATSSGARPPAWVVRVISKYDYNFYNVRVVEVGDEGSTPIAYAASIIAVNIAESFINQGTLAADTYAIMTRVGDHNVFYAVP